MAMWMYASSSAYSIAPMLDCIVAHKPTTRPRRTVAVNQEGQKPFMMRVADMGWTAPLPALPLLDLLDEHLVLLASGSEAAQRVRLREGLVAATVVPQDLGEELPS